MGKWVLSITYIGSLLFVFVVLRCRLSMHIMPGRLNCLLFLPSKLLRHSQKVDNKYDFQSSCNVKYYSMMETRQCLRNLTETTGKAVKIVLAGDSRMRQLWYGIQTQTTGLDDDWLINRTFHDSIESARPKQSGIRKSTREKKHENQVINLSTMGMNLILEYHWMIRFNDGQFADLLKNTAAPIDGVPVEMLVVSGGLWSMLFCAKEKKTKSECIKQYQRDISGHIPAINQIPARTTFVWAPQNGIVEHLMRNFTQYDPKWIFTNRDVLEYNKAAEIALSNSTAIFWRSYYEASIFYNDTLDGLHIGPESKKFDVQVLFNYLCS